MNYAAKKSPVSVLIIDQTHCLLANSIDEDLAITLIALVSEDPRDWYSATRVWPRYRTPVVCDDINDIELQEVDMEEGIETLQTAPGWAVIDFQSKRVLFAGDLLPLEPDSLINTNPDEESDEEWLLAIHLPPWWEMHADALISSVGQPRESEIKKRFVNRNVLYGTPLLHYLASRLIEADEQHDWMKYTAKDFSRKQHELAIEIHRDWLMTPRHDLGGQKPRELLHGSINWIDKIVDGQQHRFSRGIPFTGLPKDWDPDDNGPIGRSEMIMYFSMCRTLTTMGWALLNEKREEWGVLTRDEKIALLFADLENIKNDWMVSSYENDVAPKTIIEYERRRVPRGQGVMVDGFEEQGAKHEPHCDCPICEMMNDGLFGVGFVYYDSYELEMDNEFAFSMCETLEEWEQQGMAFDLDYEVDHDDESGDWIDNNSDDDLKPIWSGIQSRDEMPSGMLPGDTRGHLLMAFMLSELSGNLQAQNASAQEIDGLNLDFKAMRESIGTERKQLATALKNKLEEMTHKYPSLTPKIADFQSMIDESNRNM